MDTQATHDFNKISQAIDYLLTHFKDQPSLDDIATHIGLSPFHFQRLFTDWAGTSPKKFLQYISIEHAKKVLTTEGASILETTVKTGLSSSGRLHDLFMTIEGMTPGEYKNGGEHLIINYDLTECRFGKILIASTTKGVCYLTFIDTPEEEALTRLRCRFPRATFQQKQDSLQEQALRLFQDTHTKLPQLKLHLKGTDFQLKVWESLLRIPLGQLSTYGRIANDIHNPNACRAVGTAIGDNPVAFLIPCHRVIQSSGALGNYHWGTPRKSAMIGWEGAQTNTET